MKSKTLCLVMIVRNESNVIQRCLERVKEHINYWIIVDTGSTDNTPELIENTLLGIPGELHYRPWVNFGENRTESLRLANGKADYLLLCDADEQIIFSPQFDVNTLTKDAYMIEYQGDAKYSVPYLLKGNINWKYVGVTHEYLDADRAFTREKISNINILDLKDGGAKHDKYERDISLLEKGILDEPDNSRYKFYLANSYRDIGNYEKAVEWYHKRINDGGWIEEVTCAYENLGKCYESLGDTQKALHYWLLGYDYNPKRIECLYHAVRLLRSQEKYQLSYQLGLLAKEIPYPKDDILFIKSDLYHYFIYYQLSISAYYARDFKLGYECCRHILLAKPDNDHILGITINNLRFYLEYAKDDYEYHIRPMLSVINAYLERHPEERNSAKSVLDTLNSFI